MKVQDAPDGLVLTAMVCDVPSTIVEQAAQGSAARISKVLNIIISLVKNVICYPKDGAGPKPKN
jgi:hypothetical protein